MPFLVRGGVILDGVQFNTDPETYEPLNWPKRYSTHMAIGGAFTIQDFGLFAKDNTVRLVSGQTRPMEESVVAAIRSRYATKAGTFSFTDWVGNDFIVFIERFTPIPLKKGRDNNPIAGGTLSLYTYSLDLHVLVINQLLGAAYAGT
jgi:hypothetical protein